MSCHTNDFNSSVQVARHQFWFRLIPFSESASLFECLLRFSVTCVSLSRVYYVIYMHKVKGNILGLDRAFSCQKENKRNPKITHTKKDVNVPQCFQTTRQNDER